MAIEEADSDEAPGWAAIDRALEPVYANRQPKHWGTIVPFALGGDDPLDGISAYTVEQPPHWHFVTYGFSELYEKESRYPATSGFGFELTFRLQRDGGDGDEPPIWCVNFLQNLARYVFSSGHGFAPGHKMNLNGPIAVGRETAIQAIAFIEDPQLPPIDTPNGRLDFIQILGLTLDEIQAIRYWDAEKLLQLLVTHLPLGVTDLRRPSVLLDPAVRKVVDRGIAAEGSSTGMFAVTVLSWEQKKRLFRDLVTTIVVGANGICEFGPILSGRIPFGRPLSLRSRDAQVVFEPGSAFTIATEESGDFTTLRIALTAENAATLAGLVRPIAGTHSHPALPGLVIVVERSYIRTPEGEILETIG
jgi:suppressor of fused-like protein